MTRGIRAIEKINPGYVREMENISQEILMNSKVNFQGEKIKKQSGIFNIFRR